MKNNRKSKSILINPAFQLSVVSWFAFVAMAVIALFLASAIIFFQGMKDQGLAAGLPADHPLFRYIYTQEAQFYKIFFVSSSMVFVIVLVGGLYLSHRVAGPLYRLTRHLQSAPPQTIGKLKFRNGDYFPEIEGAFNDFISRSER